MGDKNPNKPKKQKQEGGKPGSTAASKSKPGKAVPNKKK